MGRKRGSRFRRASDAEEQYEGILQAQQLARKKKLPGKLIERTDKSKHREVNAHKGIRRPGEVHDEFQ